MGYNSNINAPGLKREKGQLALYGGPATEINRDENYFTNQQAQMGNIAIDTADWQLKQSKEQWALDKKKADTSANLATQFLSQWGGAMSTVSDMFGKAGSGLDAISKWITGGSTSGLPDDIKAQVDKLSGIQDTIMGKYQEYETTYAPMKQEFLTGARELSGEKRAAVRTMREMGTAKPEEAAAKARTDVALQNEVANRESAREMMSLGVDPSSGKFGALSRRGAIQMAGDTAKAMNVARNAEKTRSAAINSQIAQVARPSEEAAIGINIGNQGTELLKTAAGVGKDAASIITGQQAIDVNKLQAAGQIAGQYGNLATQYAGAVANPYGEMAGYFLGKSGKV